MAVMRANLELITALTVRNTWINFIKLTCKLYLGVVRDVDHGTDGIRSICHTNDDATPWIALDFGSSVTIQRVEVFNRPVAGSRTKNVYVRISDELPSSRSQMFSGGVLLGLFAGPATDGQHIVISGEKHP